jgi:small subunit ribosomal protein S1
VFVKLEDDLEGLLHISELSDTKIASPEEVLRPGMKVEVRVIRVDIEERKIGLSFVHADFEENDAILTQIEADNASGKTAEVAAQRAAVESGDVPAAPVAAPLAAAAEEAAPDEAAASSAEAPSEGGEPDEADTPPAE